MKEPDDPSGGKKSDGVPVATSDAVTGKVTTDYRPTNPWENTAAPPAPGSLEELIQTLARGIDRSIAPALSRAQGVGRSDLLPQGVFVRALGDSRVAYRAYLEALARSGGREVGIFYNPSTGEYAVMVGDFDSVGPPSRAGWYSPLHFHHTNDVFEPLTYRLPSPPDVQLLYNTWFRSHRSGNLAGLRAFIEFDIPGVGRGRTEYEIIPGSPGADPSIRVRIHKPDAAPETLPDFANPSQFADYWRTRSRFEGSPAAHEATPLPLFKQLERGFDRTQAPASRSGELANTSAPGVFAEDLETSLGAHRAFGQALKVAAGREVTIWYSEEQGRYAVTIGSGKDIPKRFKEGDWYAIDTHVPTPNMGEVVVAPLPTEYAFRRLLARFPRAVRQGTKVRAFLEFDIRGAGRGSVEYGIDSMLNPDEPLYVRVHGPNGSTAPRTFADVPDFLKRRGEMGGSGETTFHSSPANGASTPAGAPSTTEPKVTVDLDAVLPSDGEARGPRDHANAPADGPLTGGPDRAEASGEIDPRRRKK